MYFELIYCFPVAEDDWIFMLSPRMYLHQRETLYLVSFVFSDLIPISYLIYAYKYINIHSNICVYWWRLFHYKTLRLNMFLAGSLGVQLPECEARFSCHLKIIPYQKLVWDSTNLCKMELILEVSVTRVRDSSAMVIFTFTAFLLFVLCQLVDLVSHTFCLFITANELRLDTSGVEDLDKLLIDAMFEVGCMILNNQV